MYHFVAITQAAAVFPAQSSGSAGEAVYPLKLSENHRYFIDQRGEPVFWLGTTQWQLFRDNTPEDARTIIQNVKGKAS